jgi:hypothetical protein
LFALVIAGCESRSPEPAGEPGMTWQSMASLPDFSGWWEWQFTDEYRQRGPDGMPRGLPQIRFKAPLKPEISQVIANVRQAVQSATRDRKELFGAADSCLPPYFLGTNGNPFNKFEILYTPGRVTIADEMGLVRRVDLGVPMPANLVESNSGTSVGRWEAGTLIVETTGIDPDRTYFPPFRVGKGVHVLERFRLKEPDLLEISVEVTAPELMTAMFKDTFYYERRRDHRFADANNCAENDRSIDHKAGKEQLDLTPPPDLPPPPA